MSQITPGEMIEWFEGKAAEFKAIARNLRATFGTDGKVIVPASKHHGDSDRQNGEITLEMVKAATIKLPKAARCATIAKALGHGATRDQIRQIIEDNPNEFDQVGRGWWKVKA